MSVASKPCDIVVAIAKRKYTRIVGVIGENKAVGKELHEWFLVRGENTKEFQYSVIGKQRIEKGQSDLLMAWWTLSTRSSCHRPVHRVAVPARDNGRGLVDAQ